MQPIFITGIGTDVGKTLIAAILTEALEADYWKPVQAGYENGTDSDWVKAMLSNSVSRIHPETYKLRLPASPHIAAREEGIKIYLDKIAGQWEEIRSGQSNGERGERSRTYRTIAASGERSRTATNDFLIIEGAGGLLVPLTENEFVLDLIKKLHARLIIVSRNYLGSINHSLLTAGICKSNKLDIAGWIFNDQYLHYEDEIVQWTGIPSLASVPFRENPGRSFILEQARLIAPALKTALR